MAGTKRTVVYLDTHIVAWLYEGLTEKLTERARKAIEDSELYIGQMVRLELQYLYEIGRLKERPGKIINYLSRAINLQTSNMSLQEIMDRASSISWTRDVFDRILVAEAAATASGFITADSNIRTNLKYTIW
jgi:PIN domain nuclease of toxin-antitoxin system